MRTTIDSAGRVVVPKALRDVMGLTAGRPIDIAYADGRLEIELAPADVTLDAADGPPRLVAVGHVPALTDDEVRATIDAVRR
jgi:AbrB family looped-hinge helix DNA binding protein